VSKPNKARLNKLDGIQAQIRTVFQPFVSGPLSEAVVATVAPKLSAVLNSEYPVANIHQTLLLQLRPVITDAWVSFIGRQLAARSDELNVGPIMIYEQFAFDGWLAVEISGAEPSVWKDNKPGFKLSVYILDGNPAGHILKRNFPASWLVGKAYEMGFSMRRQYDDDATGLVGLRARVFAVRDKESGEPTFEKWLVPSGMEKWNKEIITKRMRFEVFTRSGDDPCPYEYDHYCNECPVSYIDCHASYVRPGK
jgi:hypothetical protein